MGIEPHPPARVRAHAPTGEPARIKRLSAVEFVALIAMLAATIAFSIDAILPALPAIGAELSPGAPNATQLIIVGFVAGMGGGTLFAGPMSDALGRKPVMLGGAALYCAAAAAATVMPTLEGVVIARVLQGIGASGPRVVAMALIRDLYAGREMARISSYVMMTFTLVPAIAPMLGAWILALTDWRGVFWAFVLFSAISGTWLAVRQPETLAPSARRPLRLDRLRFAFGEVVRHRQVRRAIGAQTLVFGVLFSAIVSMQAIYDVAFGRADTFPYWFGMVALLSGGASFLNARLVVRVGMIYLLRRALGVHLVLSVALALSWTILPEAARFPLFLVWQTASFALAGATIGNLNAIAMAPLGHVAGMASSIVSSVATMVSILLAAPVGLLFDGTPVPLVTGGAIFAGIGLLLVLGLDEPETD